MTTSGKEISNQIKRAYMLICEGDYAGAATYAENELGENVECREAYMAKLICDCMTGKAENHISDNPNYRNLVRLSADGCIGDFHEDVLKDIYVFCKAKSACDKTPLDKAVTAGLFEIISGYRDSAELSAQLKAEENSGREKFLENMEFCKQHLGFFAISDHGIITGRYKEFTNNDYKAAGKTYVVCAKGRARLFANGKCEVYQGDAVSEYREGVLNIFAKKSADYSMRDYYVLTEDKKIVNMEKGELDGFYDIETFHIGGGINHTGIRADGSIALDKDVVDAEAWAKAQTIKNAKDAFSLWRGLVWLNKDGTVEFYIYEKGDKNDEVWQNTNPELWRDVEELYKADKFIVGKRFDGSIVAAAPDCIDGDVLAQANTWRDMRKIIPFCGNLIGVCKDGTVKSTFPSYDKYSHVSDWENVASIECVKTEYKEALFGLFFDGTVNHIGPMARMFDVVNNVNEINDIGCIKINHDGEPMFVTRTGMLYGMCSGLGNFKICDNLGRFKENRIETTKKAFEKERAEAEVFIDDIPSRIEFHREELKRFKNFIMLSERNFHKERIAFYEKTRNNASQCYERIEFRKEYALKQITEFKPKLVDMD